MLKTYYVHLNTGFKNTINDVARVDYKGRAYSFYDENDFLVLSIPMYNVKRIELVDVELIKAEGSE